MQMSQVLPIPAAEERALKLTAASAVLLTSQVLEQARSPDSYRLNGLLPAPGQLFWMHLAAFNLSGLFKPVGPYVLLIANFGHAQIQPCVLLNE